MVNKPILVLMKKQIWTVIVCTFLLEMFLGPVREFLDYSDIKEAFGDFYIFDYRSFLSWNFRVYNILAAVSLYLIFYKFFPQRRTWTIAGWILAMVILVIAYRYVVEEVLMVKLIGQGNYNPNTTLRYYYIDNIYYVVLYGIVGLLIYFLQYSVYNERLKNEYLLEKEKSQHLFLKSQVKPHFLFNSLNNIYSLIHSKSDKALDAVSKLSSMLRYTLYENEEWIPLSKELTYIQDFISLEETRLPHDLSCEMKIDEDLLQYEITPYILSPFVENAFKHGVLSDPENPVMIKLYQEGSDLHFEVHNKFISKQKDKVGGIGIENVKKRLAYVYGDRQALHITKTRDSYSIHLILKEL